MTDVPPNQPLPPNQPPAPSVPPSPDTLAQDISCAQCGYNLRGLMSNSRCPECGTAIERSIHGNLLRYADPQWLDKLRLGTVLMLWNLLAGFVAGVASGILAGLGLPPVVVQMVAIGTAAFGFTAMYLLTSPEPAVLMTEDSINVRKLVRGCALASLVGVALQQTAGVAPSGVVIVATGLLVLVGTVAHFGLFVFLRRFAQRIPDPKLADQTRTVMWGYACTYGLIAIMGIAAFFAFGGTGGFAAMRAGGTPVVSGPAAGFFIIPGCVLLVTSLLFGIWYIVLLFSYHKAFKTAAALAKTTVEENVGG